MAGIGLRWLGGSTVKVRNWKVNCAKTRKERQWLWEIELISWARVGGAGRETATCRKSDKVWKSLLLWKWKKKSFSWNTRVLSSLVVTPVLKIGRNCCLFEFFNYFCWLFSFFSCFLDRFVIDFIHSQVICFCIISLLWKTWVLVGPLEALENKN